MRQKILFGGALVALSIGLTGCGGGAHAGQPAPGHSNEYNRGYNYGFKHVASGSGLMAHMLCNQYGREYSLDVVDDVLQGCVDGSAAAHPDDTNTTPWAPSVAPAPQCDDWRDKHC